MGSGRGIKSTGNMAASLPGVLNGQISEYSLENVDQKLQVFLFYPGDWSDQSQVFLSSLSSVTGGLGREDCLVYGVSSDTVNDHQDWISSSNINPSSPLIYTTREEGEEEQVEGEFDRPPCKCVVITDHQAAMLELVNTSLAEEELLAYTQDRLDMLV